MIPQKVKDHIEEYISQEVYVQIAIIKGKEKVSTETAIDKYFNTNHFRDFSEGKPYFHFIDGLRDKCLGKLKDSPMRDKATEDETIKLLQKKLNDLTDDELEDTYWEIETGEFFSGEQIKELEKNCSELIKELNFSNKTVIVEIFPSYYFRLSKIKPEKKVGYTIENINKSLEFFNSNPLKKNQIISGPDQDDADSIISSAALRFLSTDKKIWNVPNSSKKEGWIFGV